VKEWHSVILGAGIYGLYLARELGRMRKQVLVVEVDPEAFGRASYINQARVHNGYHYPRSVSTATKSARYFKRFSEEFAPAINDSFRKVYALSSKFSYTNGLQFEKFCKHSGIKCKRIDPGEYFQTSMIDAAFDTEEYAFDALRIRDMLLDSISEFNTVRILYNTTIASQTISDEQYHLILTNGQKIRTKRVINTTYASVNQLLNLFGFEMFKIKYEICEIALCKPNTELSRVGLTVMDGPFFSVMPFGLDGTFSLTSVTFTPHVTCYDALPKFKCQLRNPRCSPEHLDNCNLCSAQPKSAWDFMSQLSRRYLKDSLEFTHTKSLFAIKPILLASELDDSRPTVIRQYRTNPDFVSVLSGKINTVYDLSEVTQ